MNDPSDAHEGAAHAGPEELARAVARLRSGGLVAFPTETVYGLGADAFDESAVARVFAIKGRPAANPLIVHVSGEAMARRAASSWPPEAAALARAFWPGPLSIVVPRSPALPAVVTAGGPSVALRCPRHPLALALIEVFGSPLVGPSANRSGGVSPTRAEHVRAEFSTEEVFVLDGGPCAVGIESTVVSLTGPTPRVLRPGAVTAEEIARVLGRAVEAGPVPGAGPAESPGLMRSHYAPRARAVLVKPEAVAGVLEGARGRRVVVIDTREWSGVECVRLPGDAAGYAAGLYAALRRADESGPDLIVIVRPDVSARDVGAWSAVLDRLERATA